MELARSITEQFRAGVQPQTIGHANFVEHLSQILAHGSSEGYPAPNLAEQERRARTLTEQSPCLPERGDHL